jgi:hypothetical protein
MAAQFSTRFIRVGLNLINIEAIQRVHLKPDSSAVLLLSGPRKAVQRMLVAPPHGREIFDFVHTHLSVGDFGEPVEELAAPPAPKKKQSTKKAKPDKKQDKKPDKKKEP